MASEHIIDVTEGDFDYAVIAYSEKAPVVVDFWAEWCIPCRTLSPILERLAEEGQGAFRLAKVNVDSNPKLAMRYQVRSIPFVKAFRGGQVVAEFLGAQPEPKVREFIRKLAPSKIELALEKGESLLQLEQWGEAETTFRNILGEDAEQSRALLGLAKSLLAQGKSREARKIVNAFPASREYAAAQILLPLAGELARVENGDDYSDDPREAAYLNALRLVLRGNLPAALDGLLEVLRQDKHYRNDQPRLVFLGILELLGEDNPQARQYRQELASILF